MNTPSQSEKPVEPDVTSSLLSAAELSVERLPMLQVLFETVCEELVEQFLGLSEATLDVALERVWTGTIHEIDISNDRHIVVQLHMDEGKPSAYFIMDRPALYLLLECMLGAGGSARPYLAQHEFTALELLFAKTIANHAGQAFCRVYGEIIDVTMSVVSAHKGTDVDMLLIADEAFLTANMALEVFSRAGAMHILIPQAILAPIKNRFISVKNQDNDVSDQPWIEHIKSQLQHTDMECQATLDGGQITLGDVARMKVGQVLELGIPPDSPVRLSSNDQDLFWCQLGQAEGSFTLKISDPASEKKDFLDVMLESRELS